MTDKTVLVIPTDGNELESLEAALASWWEFGPELNEIIVAGEVSGLQHLFEDVTLVEVDQRQRRTRLNQQRILMRVIEQLAFNECNILWAHDDTFLTGRTSLEELRYLTRCANNHTEQRPRMTGDAAATENTMRRLTYAGKPCFNYELHLPLLIEGDQADTYHKLLRDCDNEMQFRTWVLNHLHDAPAKLIDDVKTFRIYEKPITSLPFVSLAKNLDHNEYFNYHSRD